MFQFTYYNRKCKKQNVYAKYLLCTFVEHFSQLCGSNTVAYNVHNLIYLADDALKQGCLENISAFSNENFFGHVLKLVKKPSQPLQQLIRRLIESKIKTLV